ncbi:MAG TPA: SDR family oxidoreductase, partial [Caulobacteraceae bacterium]|nr:SDR family oxidoreductase [Caulobacteraceae bacterium]
TRGIGRAIADLLVEEGCDVAVCARTAGQVDDAVAAFKGRGVNALGEALDVSDAEALAGFVDRAAAGLGGLDIFVANISGAMGGGNDPASWRHAVDVDILSTVRGCEAAVPHLEKTQGAIVVVGTVSIVEVGGNRRPYSSVKAAIVPYVKGLARDLAAKNVRANMVSPGSIYFEGGVWNMIEKGMPDMYKATLARNPMGRMGRPDEVADAVVFLASRRASFITGSTLIVDGAITTRVDF